MIQRHPVLYTRSVSILGVVFLLSKSGQDDRFSKKSEWKRLFAVDDKKTTPKIETPLVYQNTVSCVGPGGDGLTLDAT
jgi:hypothetical protein